jgi:glycosyltransferase involved in cell wall biosynthesis
VVCVSESTAEEVRRYYRLAETTVIPNGIDTATFAPGDQLVARERLGLQPDARYATFVGRFEHGKGGQLALEATTRAGYELLIAGPTGDGHGAHHLGVLSPEQLADAYAAADCVVFPSLYEGCSLVVLEALACGRPLITTRVGWMSTLLRAVPEYERLCVQPTVDDICTRLRELSDVDTTPLISAARAFVLEHNSLDAFGRHWQALLQGLCS